MCRYFDNKNVCGWHNPETDGQVMQIVRERVPESRTDNGKEMTKITVIHIRTVAGYLAKMTGVTTRQLH